jgi:hypothetical protein
MNMQVHVCVCVCACVCDAWHPLCNNHMAHKHKDNFLFLSLHYGTLAFVENIIYNHIV